MAGSAGTIGEQAGLLLVYLSVTKLQRQSLALGLIVAGSAALYWARTDWLVWGLMGMIATGMLLGVLGEGDQ